MTPPQFGEGIASQPIDQKSQSTNRTSSCILHDEQKFINHIKASLIIFFKKNGQIYRKSIIFIGRPIMHLQILNCDLLMTSHDWSCDSVLTAMEEQIDKILKSMKLNPDPTGVSSNEAEVELSAEEYVQG